MDIYSAKVWRKGCNYMVSQTGEFCNKCGNQHNQDAYEAEVGIFKTEKKKDEKTDDGRAAPPGGAGPQKA